MADVFKDRLDSSFDAIKSEHADKIDVPDNRKFIGFKEAGAVGEPEAPARAANPPAGR
jgi:myo-inositol 2-dehydrogenase / D-chiro-inositol 1-dehydrogenase